MRARMTALGLALLALGSLGGTARALTLAELVAGREAFDGKVVTVTGTVDRPVAVGGESLYNLRDGVAKISVISAETAPAAGASLSVTGTVHIVHEGGEDDAEGNTFPVVIRETARQPAP
jgi:hypothetical protein